MVNIGAMLFNAFLSAGGGENHVNTFLANLYLRAVAIRDRQEGQAMAEYGIILALVAAIAIVAIGVLGTKVNGAFEFINGKF